MISDLNMISDQICSVALGGFIGLVVICLLIKYPGNPYSYEPITSSCPSLQHSNSQSSAVSMQNLKSLSDRQKEIEVAAACVRIEKLQELLGIERKEIQSMIDKAKSYSISGITPEEPVNYSAWLDRTIFMSLLAVLVYVLCQDYAIDFMDLVHYFFPKEMQTLWVIFQKPYMYYRKQKLFI